MELSTFGAILNCAMELERAAADFYTRLASNESRELAATLARAHQKRFQAAQQMRRENVTEMILEPIYDLRAEDWQMDLRAATSQDAATCETKIRGFYAAASTKISIPEVARRFRKLAQESEKLQEQARQLKS